MWDGKHSFGARTGKHSFGNLQNLWVKRQAHGTLRRVTGRGVWESNPPGTAPSDPPAVLKTVRPTGAPTPPCMYVAWPYCAIHVLSCQARLRIRSTSTSVSDFT